MEIAVSVKMFSSKRTLSVGDSDCQRSYKLGCPLTVWNESRGATWQCAHADAAFPRGTKGKDTYIRVGEY
jgi:hypothetical protein